MLSYFLQFQKEAYSLHHLVLLIPFCVLLLFLLRALLPEPFLNFFLPSGYELKCIRVCRGPSVKEQRNISSSVTP